MDPVDMLIAWRTDREGILGGLDELVASYALLREAVESIELSDPAAGRFLEAIRVFSDAAVAWREAYAAWFDFVETQPPPGGLLN